MVVPSNVSYWRLTLRLSQHQKGHAGTTVPSEELTWPRLSLGSPDLSLCAFPGSRRAGVWSRARLSCLSEGGTFPTRD